MNTGQLFKSLLTVSSLMLAASCGGAPGTDSPEGVLLSSVEALRRNDLGAFLEVTLTDEQLAEAREGWREMQGEEPTPTERDEFEQGLAELTAEGAEAQILAEILPKLREMKPQMEMMVGFMTGMAQMSLDQSALSSGEKVEARKSLDALGELLKTCDISDETRAREAVGIVCEAARGLAIHTIADVQTLSFEQGMERAGILLGATKDVLALYGLTVDRVLDSVEVNTIEQTESTATVELAFEFLGTSQRVQAEMLHLGGRWVRKPEESPNPAGATGEPVLRGGFGN